MNARVHTLNRALLVDEPHSSFLFNDLLFSKTVYNFGSAKDLFGPSHVAKADLFFLFFIIHSPSLPCDSILPFLFLIFSSESVSVLFCLGYIHLVTTTISMS